MLIWVHILLGMWMEWSSAFVFCNLMNLAFWHAGQADMYWATCSIILGQKYLAVILSLVLSCPTWPPIDVDSRVSPRPSCILLIMSHCSCSSVITFTVLPVKQKWQNNCVFTCYPMLSFMVLPKAVDYSCSICSLYYCIVHLFYIIIRAIRARKKFILNYSILLYIRKDGMYLHVFPLLSLSVHLLYINRTPFSIK